MALLGGKDGVYVNMKLDKNMNMESNWVCSNFMHIQNDILLHKECSTSYKNYINNSYSELFASFQ